MGRNLPFLTPDQVRQKALDVLRAAGGSLTRDRLRVGIRTNLSTAGLDQAVDVLVRGGLIEVGRETSVYQGINGPRFEVFVTTYRLTERGREQTGE